MAASNKLPATNYDKRPAFTFIWAIENWPVYFFPTFVESPIFHVEKLQDTKWCLKIRSGEEKRLFYSIHRDILTNEDPVDAVFEISFLGSDGSAVVSKTRRKYFSTYETYEEFMLREDAFRLDRARLIENDTLTISCRLWSAEGRYLLSIPPRRCFANTRLAIERRTIFWCVRDFSQIPIGEPGVQLGLPHLSEIGHYVITLNLNIIEIFGTQQVLITILEENLPGCLYFDLSILDVEGKKNFCSKDIRYVSRDKYIRVLSIIVKDELMKGKGTMLFNDNLCLRCEFEIENLPALRSARVIFV
ncbi:uncharacterized protein TNIN_132121 [Trichonephila inaurata madagascariensis]|uniref:MATH domain-containing protein n=1 Tax=Trichonephila inaurata madagascariensis TaxID=2747483 RepID=A0A8X6YYV9_9ARAC|nr:uncharacterized protein TNIN_132121 [Trichonephila inaurata madagascariensis]